MSAVAYINPRTGASWPAERAIWRAPDDRGYVNLTPGRGLSRSDIDAGVTSLWRYAAALRTEPAAKASLGEGWTPMVPASWDGVPVLMKMEFLMPSGSFKDRGTAVMLNELQRRGVDDVFLDSSGNAGSSVATYAARLDMRCRVLVPESAPAAKRVQIRAMGAEAVRVPGTREDVAKAALREAEQRFYASHNWQPFFIEGTKTLGFEIWEQLRFRVPDAIVVPAGYGSNVIGCHIGFRELLAAGQIDRLPRIYAVQAANCAGIAAALAAGTDGPADLVAKPTLADGIATARPIRVPDLRAALKETGGSAICVEEEEIPPALRAFAAAGFFVEPTSATAGAALGKLLRTGAIRAGETIVVVLTGSGLKAVEKIGALLD